MAIYTINIQQNKSTKTTIYEFICDTDADFANLPPCEPGSTAISAASGNVYIVNASGEWVAFGGE